MKHFAGPSFWECYNKLPRRIQDLADKKFDKFKKNPQHPSLKLKKVDEYWSVRVGIRYRALGIDVEKGVLCFWIGTHAEYDKMVNP